MPLEKSRRTIISCILAIALPLLIGIGFSALFAVWKLGENGFYISFTRTLATIVIFVSASLVIIEATAHIFNKEASWNTLFVAIGVLLLYGASPDAYQLYGIDPNNTPEVLPRILHVISHLGLSISMIGVFRFFKNNYKIHFEKYEILVSYSIPLISSIALYPLSLIGASYAATFLDLFIAAYWVIKSFYFLHRSHKGDIAFVYTVYILNLAVVTSLVIALGEGFPNHFLGVGIPSLLGFAVVLLFYAVYLSFVIRITRSAYKKEEFERKATELQSAVLKEQIKPHFIFNVLNAVKLAYKNDPEKGEMAIDLFSKYLRSSTEASSVYLVPLQKELDVISHYVELENIKVSKPYRLIFNIDAFDFEVPYFGLQPLIENAIKYGHLDPEDGYIEITTVEEDSHYLIRVYDNGVGFDVNQIAKDSYGIGNTRARFQLLLNASFDIQSSPGNGTAITITIPKGESPYESDRRR